jgi:hypothetical protein
MWKPYENMALKCNSVGDFSGKSGCLVRTGSAVSHHFSEAQDVLVLVAPHAAAAKCPAD